MLDYPDRTFSREAIRQVDAVAVERFGIPGIVLMENAARGIAIHAADMLRPTANRRALILCGGGNNGGDGFAAARHLHNMAMDCTLLLTRSAEDYKGDAATNLAICRAMGLPLVEAADDPLAAARGLAEQAPPDLILDALMGTGLSSPVRSPLAEVVRWLNAQPTPVLAVDIPTGLDADTGEPLGGDADGAVRAVVTATMVGRKRGFVHPGVHQYVGDIYVVDIGVPRELIFELGDDPEAADDG